MRTITLRGAASLLTLTHPNRFVGLGLKYVRRKISSFVRAVAESPVGGQTAGAICVIFSGFQFDLLGETSSDFWFIHLKIYP